MGSGAQGIDLCGHASGHRRAVGTRDVVFLERFRVGRVERSGRNGNVITSPVARRPSLERMGIEMRDTLNVGPLTAAERQFLAYHRDMVVLRSAGSR